MAEYLFTMRETVKENVEDLESLGGARIVVTIVGVGAGQMVYLNGIETTSFETVSAETDADGVAIFDNLQYGEYTVIANILGNVKTQNVTIDTLKIYEVSLSMASSTLDENSWAVISKVSASGEAANYWNAGDTKTITINGTIGSTTFSNLSIDAYILGINHNADLEGNNRIHFCIGKVNNIVVGLTDSKYNQYPMTSSGYFSMSYSSSDTNAGGWNDCYMKNSVMQWIKNALPIDLQTVLKTVTKYTDNVGSSSGNVSSNVTATTETICLEAEFEVQGARKSANSYEQDKQKQYDYYKNGSSKIRRGYNNTSTAVYWWNRSPSSDNSGIFCAVDTDGSGGGCYSRRCGAVAPCFYV